MNRRASFVSESTKLHQKALIVSAFFSSLAKELKLYLEKHDIEVFLSPTLPESKTQFDLCYVTCTSKTIHSFIHSPPQTVFILIDEHKKTLRRFSFPKQKKIVRILGDEQYAVTQIQRIVWFSLTKHTENRMLTLESVLPIHERKQHIHTKKPKIQRHFPLRLFFSFLIFVFFLFLTAFFIPLGLSYFYTYRAVRLVQAHSFSEASKTILLQQSAQNSAESLYKPVRPLYLLFSLAYIPDDALYLNKLIAHIILTGQTLQSEGTLLAELILQPNKSPSQQKLAQSTFEKTSKLLSEIESSSVLLYQKVPPLLLSKKQKESFGDLIAQMRKVKKIYSYLPDLLGVNGKKTILLLFANNMEIRPGGGFIGSYGILHTDLFGIQNLKIYDVYDADGQLKAHIEPPMPIRTYLNQPHWFLRDSAFFPDFYDTYKQAAFFLEKEMGLTNWDGAALITTSAVKDIIGAFPSLLLTDYGETITKDNFYIKTQYYSEHFFFPGSTQKKSFLSALVHQLFSEVTSADPVTLSRSVLTALDQKNIVIYMEDERLQQLFTDYYWSGRLASPFCSASSGTCINDSQFVLDANLGVNKANFFVDKTYSVDIVIDPRHLIQTTISVAYTNNSLANVFPGGAYKNYVQILLPAQSIVQSVTVENARIDSYNSETTEKNKIIGFLLQIPPQEKRTVTVQYQLSTTLNPGKNTYQLVIQKQIGLPSSDLSFKLTLPKTVQLKNQNFSPLVNHNQIIYNTDLSTDRIFFIELLRD